jgi:hypothetical protein
VSVAARSRQRQQMATTFNLATQTLPVTGTYTILVDARMANTGSINVALTTVTEPA